MKNKKIRINYYILAFAILIVTMFMVDQVFDEIIADNIMKNILQDKEEIKTSFGYVTRGNFYWSRLRDYIIVFVVSGFLLMEIVVYITTKISKKKAMQETINIAEERIMRITQNQIPYEDNRFKFMDRQIEDIMKENDVVTYLAHDLKTPLTTIIGYSTLLQDKDIPQDIRQKYIKTILVRV